MIPQKHRVAIARILSDLIKSDKIIEQSEIKLYNQLQQTFGITQKDRIDAQYITLSRAIMDVRDLDDRDKEELQNALSRTANADNQCVAREALILLTLKYVLYDTDEKYEVISCATNESYIDDKFMVVVDSSEYQDDDTNNIETIIDKLNLWNIEFVYIPQIAEKLKSLDSNYIRSIIRYMNPRFHEKDVEKLYHRLISITTAEFTTQLLGGEMNMPTLKEVEPSLLINYATSNQPYSSQDNKGQTFTEFLRIRIDDYKLEEVRRFIQDYDSILTHRESVRPQIADNYFRYYGFYKVLFDFISQSENGKLITKDVLISPLDRTITFAGYDVKFSPMYIATYTIILQQSIKGHGLPRFPEKDSKKTDYQPLFDELTIAFKKIYRNFTAREELSEDWNFRNNTRNIAACVSHINAAIKRAHLRDESRCLIKQERCQDGMSYYTVNISVDDVFVKNDIKRQRDLKERNPVLAETEIEKTPLKKYLWE